MKKIVLLCAIACASMISTLASAADIGVVLMHGKWGTDRPASATGKLALALKSDGVLIDFSEMPWSRDRAYDRDVEGALAEIDAAVKRLKDKGATHIVVAGQSLGANIAMAYAARRDGLAGVMAISPGHVPELGQTRQAYATDVARARAMVTSDQGDAKGNFLDINQGERKTLSVVAKSYLTWMAPDGIAVMPTNAPRLKPGTPLFWMVGDKDAMSERGKAYAYDKAPAHPKSAYIVVPGGTHGDTQLIGVPHILQWLKEL